MIIQKLDGPKGDPILDGGNNIIGHYQGIVTGTQQDLVDGDWARWTWFADDGVTVVSVAEHRWFARPTPQPRGLDASAQGQAMIKGRASALDKEGKYLEASALRATIGE